MRHAVISLSISGHGMTPDHAKQLLRHMADKVDDVMASAINDDAEKTGVTFIYRSDLSDVQTGVAFIHAAIKEVE